MTHDKITRIVLVAIALGLWMNALNPWLKPVPVAAQEDRIEKHLSEIEHDVHAIYAGTCLSKICD